MESSHEFQSFVLYVYAVFSLYKISLLFLLHHVAFPVASLLLFINRDPTGMVCVSPVCYPLSPRAPEGIVTYSAGGFPLLLNSSESASCF